jgi:hypothetical protein
VKNNGKIDETRDPPKMTVDERKKCDHSGKNGCTQARYWSVLQTGHQTGTRSSYDYSSGFYKGVDGRWIERKDGSHRISPISLSIGEGNTWTNKEKVSPKDNWEYLHNKMFFDVPLHSGSKINNYIRMKVRINPDSRLWTAGTNEAPYIPDLQNFWKQEASKEHSIRKRENGIKFPIKVLKIKDLMEPYCRNRTNSEKYSDVMDRVYSFNLDEWERIASTMLYIRPKTAMSLSKKPISHSDFEYKITEHGRWIPFNSPYSSFNVPTTQECLCGSGYAVDTRFCRNYTDFNHMTYIENVQRFWDSYYIVEKKQCFPGNAIVQTPDGEVSMKELSIGQKVMVYEKGEIKFQRLLGWTHKKQEGTYKYIELETDNDKIVLTPGHYIICNNELIRAIEVKVGDKLLSSINGKILKTTVLRTRVFDDELGIYNPHTQIGTIIVNNIVASCYTSALPKIANKVVDYSVRNPVKVLAPIVPVMVYRKLLKK